MSGTPTASAEAGWVPELSPWREGERDALPVSFATRGGVGLSILLDVHADGRYERAWNGCLGRVREESGSWEFVGSGFVLEGDDPLPGGRWLGAIELTPDAEPYCEPRADVLLVAKDAEGRWALVDEREFVLMSCDREPGETPSVWNSIRVPVVDPLVEEAAKSW